VLAVESVTGGDFLGGESEAQVLSDAGRRGRVVIGASRLGQAPGILGEGRVATIVFRAVAAGVSRLTFADGRALDALLQPLAPFRADAATVSVEAAATPQPERREELREELRGELRRTPGSQGPKS
jgi:hypothetical protein